MNTKFLTLAEVAKLKGVTVQAVRMAVKSGKMNGSQKIGSERGGVWIVPEQAAHDWTPRKKSL